MNTEFPSPQDIKRVWHVLDAESEPLGRVASQAAMLLMGKHKTIFTPFLDTGDHVIVLNAAKVRLTGRKEDQKLYRRHSGYPGGLSEVSARKVRSTRPAQLVYDAVAGMLPKTKLGKRMLRKLRVYPGDKHPHQAQKPVALSMAK
ncbi:MAG: 50S ribosomal protein L13 [Rhodospirillales bacterium]